VFLVVWVELEREVAHLIPIAEGGTLEENIPFRAIRPVAKEHR
jgi:hypothetical protein